MNIDDQMRQEIAMPLAALLKKFVDVRQDKSHINFHTGKIVDNDDPDKLGRCKIRVYGVFEEEIPDEDLPWAIPDFNFIGSELGSFIVPPTETIVKVYFDNNDFHTPRYTTKVIETNNMNFAAGKDEDYPDTMIFFETDAGDYFKINRKTYMSTYRHASGLMITIDKFGSITLDNKGSETGDLIIGIEGDTTISVRGDTKIDSIGDVSIDSTAGNVNLGKNITQNLVNNLPNCLVTGAPHTLQSNVKA